MLDEEPLLLLDVLADSRRQRPQRGRETLLHRLQRLLDGLLGLHVDQRGREVRELAHGRAKGREDEAPLRRIHGQQLCGGRGLLAVRGRERSHNETQQVAAALFEGGQLALRVAGVQRRVLCRKTQ